MGSKSCVIYKFIYSIFPYFLINADGMIPCPKESMNFYGDFEFYSRTSMARAPLEP